MVERTGVNGWEPSWSAFSSNRLSAFQRFLVASRRANPNCRRSCRRDPALLPLEVAVERTLRPKNVQVSLSFAAKPIVFKILLVVLLPRHSIRAELFQLG